MKLKYVACVLLTLTCGGAFAANSLLDDSSDDSSLVNTDTAPAPTIPGTGGGVSPQANLQSTIASQQAKLLTQMQALQQSMSNLQQTMSNLQGIVNNHEQAIQQMQLQMMTMKQSMASQGKSRPMLMNAPAQASPSGLPTNLTPSPTPSAAVGGVLNAQTSTAMTSANGTPVMQSVQAPVESAAPVVETTAPAVAKTPAVAKNTGLNQEQRLYQVADQQVRTKDYSTAIASFQVYLQKYPKGQFADNAHYWLGQLYGIAGNDGQSQQELMTVISSYPKSNKVPDAMLQLGMMAYSNGQYNDASRWFNKLLAQYPASAPARLARQQLLQLQKAGY